jgi:predicted AlkP superfamily phosphohydrolase/phosphomutase
VNVPSNRVLVVGLDGATLDLIEPWSRAGALPTFQRIMAEGAYGPLRSTIPPMTAPAWTSFMTGKNPGKHGLYDWINRCSDSYGVRPVTAAQCREPTLWTLLSDVARRVCLVNVPMTYPPTPVNGVMISGLPAPSTRVSITYPPGLLAELERDVGEYLLYPDPGQAYSDSGVDLFLEDLYRTTDTRLQVVEKLRAREDWDFCMVVLNGTDTVQHAMWKYMSPDHPLHDPRKSDKYGDAILRYFQHVDGALDRLVTGLDSDITLVIMSDHGFGPFHKFIHLNNWLRQEGWLRIKSAPKARIKSTFFDLGMAPMRIYDLLMQFGFGALKREVVRGNGQGLLRRLFLSFDDVDWQSTAAYALGNVGQIFLNVRGREPQGLVEPGEQYEAIRDGIIARLLDLRDPQSGEQVVESVYRREEVYWGHNVDQAADIVFIPTRMEYFGFGEYEFGSDEIIESMKRGISGTHRLNGLVMLWGNAVQAGTQIQNAQIFDLAPTILRVMGEPVPQDMDGRVLSEVLTPEYTREIPIAKTLSGEAHPAGSIGTGDLDSAASTGPSTEAQPLTDEDADLLAERLRRLGYVG